MKTSTAVILISTFISLLLTNSMFAQYPGWTIYTTANSGIGGDTTLAIFEDNESDLWFGTIDGATKYDGNNWTTYNSSNSTFMNYTFTSSIEQIADTMYFASSNGGGVHKFYENTWELIPANSPQVLQKDQYNNLWIGTQNNGLIKYSGGILTNYNTSNSPLRSNYITGLEIDDQQSLWITMSDNSTYNNAGVAKFDGTNWTIYHSQNSGLINENIRSVTKDNDGSLWFGGDSLYLFKYDFQNWTYVNALPSNSRRIITLDVDSLNNIWIGTENGGAFKYDRVSFTHFREDNSGLPSNYVSAVKVDSENNKWFGTWFYLAKFDVIIGGLSWRNVKKFMY